MENERYITHDLSSCPFTAILSHNGPYLSRSLGYLGQTLCLSAQLTDKVLSDQAIGKLSRLVGQAHLTQVQNRGKVNAKSNLVSVIPKAGCSGAMNIAQVQFRPAEGGMGQTHI